MARRSLFITYLATYLLTIATYLVTLALISAQDHIGFASMQERVDALGGEIDTIRRATQLEFNYRQDDG